MLIFDREVEYDEIREVLKEQSVCKGVIEIPRVVIKEVPKIIEIKQVVEREKIVYIKTAEVQSEEALYNAKLERQRQCLKATRCALSLSLLQPLLARQAYCSRIHTCAPCARIQYCTACPIACCQHSQSHGC